MANPFSIQPGGDLTQGLSGLAQVLTTVQDRDRRQQAEENTKRRLMEFQERAKTASDSNDKNAIADLIIDYPEFQQVIDASVGYRNKATKDNLIQSYQEALSNPDRIPQLIEDRRELVLSEGGEPDDYDSELMAYQADPQGYVEEIENRLLFADPQGFKAYQDLKKSRIPEKQEFEQGRGSMEGYAFNKSTGEYVIDERLKQDLAKDAQEKATKGGLLSPKDVAGVNNKITDLTKDVRGIKNAADDLAALKASSSPSSQLAAIFKFMKSLDPTSVVREGEQQMARRTGGPADYLVGLVNQIEGEGSLPPRVFSDMVDTAKRLANSAIDSSDDAVTGYLDVIADNLTQKQYENLKNRIPKKFEIGGTNRVAQDALSNDELSDEELLKRYGGN